MLPLAFTGHRRINGKYVLPPQVKANIEQAILKARRWGFDDFRCGLAVGADQIAAQIALDLGFNLHAYLPFKGFEVKWPDAQKLQYYQLLDKAKVKRYVSEPPYYAWKMILRDKVMVEETSLVIALWDGRREGGTYTTVQYAKELGIPVWNAYGESGWI